MATQSKLNKATLKTLRSIKRATRTTDWAYMGEFNFVHMKRLEGQ